MTTILKTDAVTEALNKAIEAQGADYVYPDYETQCWYTDRDAESAAPSCIVGWVVDAIDHEALEKIAEYEAREEESFGVTELVDYAGLEFESVVLCDALQVAQRVQDRGAPWSYAKRAYDEVLAGGYYYDVEEQVLGEWNIEQRQREEVAQ